MADPNDGKMKVKLLKVYNKATGHKSSTPYLFSAQNWKSKTMGYKLAVNK
jgi:hypothetical protein